jgi:hypothetical protein
LWRGGRAPRKHAPKQKTALFRALLAWSASCHLRNIALAKQLRRRFGTPIPPPSLLLGHIAQRDVHRIDHDVSASL